MEEKQKAETGHAGGESERWRPDVIPLYEDSTAAPGAKEAASGANPRRDVNLLLAFVLGLQVQGNCTLSEADAATVNEIEARWRTPALDAGKVAPGAKEPGCTCPERCALHNWQDAPAPGVLRGESALAPLKAALDAGKAARGEFERARLIAIQLEHETSYHDPNGRGSWNWSCSCGATDWFKTRDDCHRKTREHWADVILAAVPVSLPPVSIEAREATPAAAPITYSEGKKIYDQGWNDGIDHLQKLLTLAVEQRLGR